MKHRTRRTLSVALGGIGAIAGLPSTTGLLAQPGEPAAPVAPTVDDPGAVAGAIQNQASTPAARAMARQTVLDSLRAMKRDPKAIQVACAECYKMAAPPPDIRFTCPTCGSVATLSRTQEFRSPEIGGEPAGTDLTPGELAEAFPAIQRAVARLPYPVVVDPTPLCVECSKVETRPELKMVARCLGCDGPVAWKVDDRAGLRELQWLFVHHPVTRLDGNELDLDGADPGPGITSGAVWLHQHLFCPPCRSRYPLDQ